MTHIAATSTAAATTATPRATSARTTGASFAAAHTAAVRGTEDKNATATASTSAPKGEKTQKVDGHHYVEIISGPRNGMFINNSGNGRDGDAFVIVKRDGREFHIYGTGTDRAVYEVGRDRAGSGTSQGSGQGGTGSGTSGATGSSPTSGA